MRHAIYSLEGQFLGAYDGERDESSKFRSHLLCPPHAIHLEVPEGLDEECLELFEEPGTPGQEFAPDIWVKGEELVYEKPEDETGWEFLAGKPLIPPTPGRKVVRENAGLKLAKKQRQAELVLNQIRSKRNELLSAADIAIYKLEDLGQDTKALRAYRVELRNCTDDLKDSEGKAKLECAELNADSFLFPIKP